MDTEADRATFYWELMKLLLQIAWADDKIAPEERAVVRKLGARLGLQQAQMQEVEACLEGNQPLPAPNMALLREHRKDVLMAAERIARADKVFTEEEKVVMDGLQAILTDKPRVLDQSIDGLMPDDPEG